MKNAYRSVMFYIGQTELEMQCKMNRRIAQCRQKCEVLQEKFSEKMKQMHTGYQKMAKRYQMMEQEIENLTRDKQELQDKFAEKLRQKRNLMKCMISYGKATDEVPNMHTASGGIDLQTISTSDSNPSIKRKWGETPGSLATEKKLIKSEIVDKKLSSFQP